jgi:hypothetical protein
MDRTSRIDRSHLGHVIEPHLGLDVALSAILRAISLRPYCRNVSKLLRKAVLSSWLRVGGAASIIAVIAPVPRSPVRMSAYTISTPKAAVPFSTHCRRFELVSANLLVIFVFNNSYSSSFALLCISAMAIWTKASTATGRLALARI